MTRDTCPKCRDRGLERRKGVKMQGIWSCPGCHGIWLEPYATRRLPLPDLTVGEPPAQVADVDGRAGLCPAGHGLLTRAQTHVDDGFYLDRCSACGGIWFDRGEWEPTAKAGLAASLHELWTASWQAERRRERAAEAYRRRLADELGPELVERIDGLAAEIAHHPSRELALGLLMQRLRSLPVAAGGRTP